MGRVTIVIVNLHYVNTYLCIFSKSLCVTKHYIILQNKIMQHGCKFKLLQKIFYKSSRSLPRINFTTDLIFITIPTFVTLIQNGSKCKAEYMQLLHLSIKKFYRQTVWWNFLSPYVAIIVKSSAAHLAHLHYEKIIKYCFFPFRKILQMLLVLIFHTWLHSGNQKCSQVLSIWLFIYSE